MPETSPASKTSTCHKTVRSGTIYDFDMQERRRESLERAEKLKAELGDEPITGTDDRIAYRFVKRVFDFVFSAAVLVLLSWLFVIIAILVKVDDPKGPVFFKQTRVGKNGREFEMLKFRSMCVDAEEKLADLKELNEKTGPVFKIAEDPRITRIGKWLRKLSLDELPQFINVLRSDMSVVGPRPALPNEVATYNDYQRQRLLVKPGMTCYWQTRRNRDSITFDEWVDLDLWRFGHLALVRAVMLGLLEVDHATALFGHYAPHHLLRHDDRLVKPSKLMGDIAVASRLAGCLERLYHKWPNAGVLAAFGYRCALVLIGALRYPQESRELA